MQPSTIETLDRELNIQNVATKAGEVPSLYQQLMVPNDAPICSITRRFGKLRPLCHPDQGGTQEELVWLHRAHRVLTYPDAPIVYEFVWGEAADNVLSFENNLDSWTLFSLRRQQRIDFLLAHALFVFWLLCCFGMRLTSHLAGNRILRKFFEKMSETSVKRINFHRPLYFYKVTGYESRLSSSTAFAKLLLGFDNGNISTKQLSVGFRRMSLAKS